MNKYYYCPQHFIDLHYSLGDYVSNINYYIQKIKKYNKVFESYEDLLDFICENESVERKDILELDFTNNPSDIGFGLEIIHKANKKYRNNCNIINFFSTPLLGYVFIEYRGLNII